MSSEVERALALRDVMAHAVKVERETAAAKGPRKTAYRSVVLALTCVPLLAFSVYSYVARPEFIWGPPVQSIPPEEYEAGLKFAMFLLAQRVESYRDVNGALPGSLEALGDSIEGVQYHALSDTVFELSAMMLGKRIALRSDQPVDAFLGNSPAVLQGMRP